MEKLYRKEWDESYSRGENNILYPKEEVVKFLNRFIRKKKSHTDFKDILNHEGDNLKGLDYGCGIGRNTALMDEFKIDSYGLDISKKAIEKAKSFFPNLAHKFRIVDGKELPFTDSFFDFTICDSVIDSMHFDVACTLIKELDRVTSSLVFISLIHSNSPVRDKDLEEIVNSEHERGTIQSWYSWPKIKKLISQTSLTIVWANLVSEDLLIPDDSKNGRYHLVLQK